MFDHRMNDRALCEREEEMPYFSCFPNLDHRARRDGRIHSIYSNSYAVGMCNKREEVYICLLEGRKFALRGVLLKTGEEGGEEARGGPA